MFSYIRNIVPNHTLFEDEDFSDVEDEDLEGDWIPEHYVSLPEPENYLLKAIKAYDSYEYKKCLDYINDYEKALLKVCYRNNQRLSISNQEEAVILSYQAYSLRNLKKYESAKSAFKELADVMKKGSFHPECLFHAYFELAGCYAALGEMEKSKHGINRLVESNLGPSQADLEARNYKINRQPCFHYAPMSVEDKLIINTISATVIGERIVALQGQEELVSKICPCSNENINSCKDWCCRIGGIAAAITNYIPNKTLQALTLMALIEFQISCLKCCEEGFGSENCLKKLKWILSSIGDGVLKD